MLLLLAVALEHWLLGPSQCCLLLAVLILLRMRGNWISLLLKDSLRWPLHDKSVSLPLPGVIDSCCDVLLKLPLLLYAAAACVVGVCLGLLVALAPRELLATRCNRSGLATLAPEAAYAKSVDGGTEVGAADRLCCHIGELGHN